MAKSNRCTKSRATLEEILTNRNKLSDELRRLHFACGREGPDLYLQEIMNRVLAAERMSQVQLVEARTKAETQRLEAQSRFETQRLEAESPQIDTDERGSEERISDPGFICVHLRLNIN